MVMVLQLISCLPDMLCFGELGASGRLHIHLGTEKLISIVRSEELGSLHCVSMLLTDGHESLRQKVRQSFSDTLQI